MVARDEMIDAGGIPLDLKYVMTARRGSSIGPHL